MVQPVKLRRANDNDAHTSRVLANAVAVGVNLVGPATAQLMTELSDLGEGHSAHDALSLLARIADGWLRDAARALESEHPADVLRGLSATACDAVDEWSRADGRTVYRTLATRWPWPAARRLVDSIVAADEIVAIATGVIADDFVRRAAHSIRD
jgi:hypothetical protein